MTFPFATDSNEVSNPIEEKKFAIVKVFQGKKIVLQLDVRKKPGVLF